MLQKEESIIQGGVKRIKWWFLYLFHWFPLSYSISSDVVQRSINISERLDEAGVYGLTQVLGNPWELLATFRTIISGKVKYDERPILKEVENVHTKLLFSFGIALSLLLLGLQSFFIILCKSIILILNLKALTIWSSHLPDVSFLLILGIGGLIASFSLRGIAGKWLAYEMLLTLSLAQRLEQQGNQPSKEEPYIIVELIKNQ